MSDYFGALLRSAGASSADVRRPAADAATGLVEQTSESVAVVGPPAGVALPTGALAMPDPAPVREPDRLPLPPSDAAPPRVSPAASRPPTADRASPAPAVQPVLGEEVHPLVRAALRWVGADAEERADRPPAMAAGSPDTAPAADAVQRRAPPSVIVRSPADARPPGRVRAAAEEGAVEPGRAPSPAGQPQPATDVDLDLDIASVARAQPARGGVPSPAHERIEISIGTVHVSVDAPPAARAVVAPAPAPQRAPAARPDARGGFARSRLPRS